MFTVEPDVENTKREKYQKSCIKTELFLALETKETSTCDKSKKFHRETTHLVW
jgi:hypothetical protein